MVELQPGPTAQGQGWAGLKHLGWGCGENPGEPGQGTETSECPQGPDSSSPFILMVTHSKVSSFEEKEGGKETYPLHWEWSLLT